MTAPLPSVRIGATTLHVPSLGLGTAPLANLYTHISETQALETIRYALSNGINLFDTAPLYGAGLAERRLGAVLRDIPRDSYVLSTKVGRLVTSQGSVVFDWTRDGVLRCLEDSLDRLGVEYVDILHIHDPDQHQREALDVVFPALAELRSQGVIRAVGAGVNQWQMLVDFAHHADFDCFLLAGRYTLLEQGALDLLELCHARGISILLGGVYNSGILATGAQPGAKYNYADAPPVLLEQVRRIETICARYDAPLKAAALQFPLAHPAVTSLVVGAQSMGELAETIDALHTTLPQGLWDDLRSAGLVHESAPLP